jgi:NMT1/THI5 like protein
MRDSQDDGAATGGRDEPLARPRTREPRVPTIDRRSQTIGLHVLCMSFVSTRSITTWTRGPALQRGALRIRRIAFGLLTSAATVLLLAGCGSKSDVSSPTSGATGLTRVRFQTDWYAQPEHGGFYQALAKGFYREAGLDVEILVGSPGPTVPQKMMGGAADIGMGASDSIMVNIHNGLPLVIISASMQHDPQAILLHEENPVNSFPELNGKAIMAVPGSNWIDYLKAQYGIDFKLIPMNYSLAQFMTDKNFIQQCFIRRASRRTPQSSPAASISVSTPMKTPAGIAPHRRSSTAGAT